MSELKPTPAVKATARSTPPAKPNKRDVLKYPLLVHAPAHWGPGVRTEDHGIRVEDLVADVAKRAGEGAGPEEITAAIAATAAEWGTTPEHVEQACRYCLAIRPTE